MDDTDTDTMSPAERKAWIYLCTYQTATAEEVSRLANVPLEVAQNCVSRIGTPLAVRALRPPAPQPVEGSKFDSSKPRYDLLPPELLAAVADVLTFGANKYGERNWELGMAWGRPFAAMMRHMWAWWRGEGRDPETGLSHLAHAACCVAFLLAYERRQIGTDDRAARKGEVS
jgi:hypothetical protein